MSHQMITDLTNYVIDAYDQDEYRWTPEQVRAAVELRASFGSRRPNVATPIPFVGVDSVDREIVHNILRAASGHTYTPFGSEGGA